MSHRPSSLRVAIGIAAATLLIGAAGPGGAVAQSPDAAAAAPSPSTAVASPCPTVGGSPSASGPAASAGTGVQSMGPDVRPAACVPVAPTAEWGPMAVVHDTVHEGADAGFGPGTLSIGDACVTLVGDGWETTLVFRDWQAGWDAASGTIHFEQPPGELLALEGGLEVAALGGYAAWDEDTEGEAPAPPWLVEPNPDCPQDLPLWLVHSVSVR